MAVVRMNLFAYATVIIALIVMSGCISKDEQHPEVVPAKEPVFICNGQQVMTWMCQTAVAK